MPLFICVNSYDLICRRIENAIDECIRFKAGRHRCSRNTKRNAAIIHEAGCFHNDSATKLIENSVISNTRRKEWLARLPILATNREGIYCQSFNVEIFYSHI